MMSIEILGVRLLAPTFGSSYLVWTAQIGVILGALTGGYFLGGALADRTKWHRPVGFLLLAAGIWLAAATSFGENIVEPLLGMDVRLGSLLASLILYGIPGLMLGAVSPFLAARLILASKPEETGRTLGRAYAISTLGSLIGTFLTGFFLLGTIPYDHALYLQAGVLAFSSVFFFPGKGRGPALGGVLLVILIGITSLRSLEGVLADVYTPYHHLLIADTRIPGFNDGAPVRALFINRKVSSLVRRDDLSQMSPFYPFFRLGELLQPRLLEPSSGDTLLMLGDGPGTITRDLAGRYPGILFHSIEIDPMIKSVFLLQIISVLSSCTAHSFPPPYSLTSTKI